MDPYKVLGISPNATDEEVKQAYRKLAKKYHPDRYQNSPLAETASEKMKEINAAYDQIMKQRKEGYSGSSSYTSYSGNTYSGVDRSGSGGERMNHVRMLLNQGRFEEAERLLDQVMPTDRTAEWYYLMGVVSYRKGWLEEAFNYVQTACRLDPGNTEYQSFYNSILNARAGQTIHYRGGNSGCCTCDDACSICSCLLCLNSCCNICGR